MKLGFAFYLFIISFSTQVLAQEISAPFASGIAKGDLRWEVRFNLPDCNHEGKAPGAWCQRSDDFEASKKSGVEDRLVSWLNDPQIKSVYLAYLSFSNRRMKKAICEAAQNGKKIHLFLDSAEVSGNEMVHEMDDCSENTTVYSRGKGPFGTSGAHLQHMKIFMALESENLEVSKNQRVRFSSSSANMSGSGTSLHFENWMFFDAPAEDYLAKQNVCVFKSMIRENDRRAFRNNYETCVDQISGTPRKDIEFFPVPAGKNVKRPYQAMKEVVDSAKNELLVAIHRLTTKKIYADLFREAAWSGVKVKVIMDDDTLRTSKINGGPAHDVGKDDVFAYWGLKRYADFYFMETNYDPSGWKHLMHNKFIVADGKTLFTGAGNFTATSLNISGDGNYEQFYKITIPEIVRAYRDAWLELQKRATPDYQHEVFNNQDKKNFGSF